MVGKKLSERASVGWAWAVDTLCQFRRRTSAIGVAFCAALVAGALVGCAVEAPRIGEKMPLVIDVEFGGIAWSRDGAAIAVEYGDTVWLLDVRRGESRALIKGVDKASSSDRRAIEFSRDGSFLVTRRTEAWDMRSGRLAWRWDGWFRNALMLACSADAEFVFSGARHVALVDPATGKVRAVLDAEPYASRGAVKCSPDGRFLARSYQNGVVTVWDIPARAKVGQVKVGAGDEPPWIALGPGAEWLAAWVGDQVQVFPRNTWTSAKKIDPPDVGRPTVSIDVRSRNYVHSDLHDSTAQRTFTASADGRYLAMSGRSLSGGLLANDVLSLVDLREMSVVRLPSEYGHHRTIDIVFSPDGAMLAILGPRGINVWDVRAAMPVAQSKP